MRACEVLIASSLVTLAACQAGVTSAVEAADLIGRSWNLENVDGVSLTDTKRRPHIAFADELKISGFAGCNRFFGQATLEEGRLVTGPVGTTRMACPPPQEDLEQKVLAVLTNGCEIELEGGALTLRGGGHTLVYQPAEQPGERPEGPAG
jgi:heat shock protein HslJ